MVQVEVIDLNELCRDRGLSVARTCNAQQRQKTENAVSSIAPLHVAMYCFIDDTPLLNLGHSMY